MPKRLTRKQQAELKRKRQEAAQRRQHEDRGVWGQAGTSKNHRALPKLATPKWAADPTDIPSAGDRIKPTYHNPTPRYRGDMAEREAQALAVAEEKSKMVAPLFNKGAYQLITPETNLADLGRKT